MIDLFAGGLNQLVDSELLFGLRKLRTDSDGPDEGALIFERQADPMRLLDPPLRRASLLSNAEVARLMVLSHSGPEGYSQLIDLTGYFGLASFRQKRRVPV